MGFQIVKLVDAPTVNINLSQSPSITSLIFGSNPAVDGNWQIIVSGNNLSFQRMESGVWVEKSNITP